LNTVERWEKSGVALHVIDLGGSAIDTTSAAGRFMLVVLAGAAEMERNLTRERTRSAMAVKRSNNQRIGAVPYGYDLADDGVTLILNNAEQAIIRDFRCWRASGWTLKQIADNLTDRSVPTKTGKSDHWSHQAVARMLTRPH
jgi:site-specific DNA recombinase